VATYCNKAKFYGVPSRATVKAGCAVGKKNCLQQSLVSKSPRWGDRGLNETGIRTADDVNIHKALFPNTRQKATKPHMPIKLFARLKK
jgi:hypothetical protein